MYIMIHSLKTHEELMTIQNDQLMMHLTVRENELIFKYKSQHPIKKTGWKWRLTLLMLAWIAKTCL